jgi:hypothetical protein
MALSNSDLDEMYTAYTTDNFARFERACVGMFVNYWVSKIPHDIKDRLLDAIRYSRTRRDMWVRFPKVISPDHKIEIDGRVMYSHHIIHKTDALAQVAAAIGDHIHVRPAVGEDGNTILRIEYWPPRVHNVPNPEDLYADMPSMDDYPHS